MKKTKKENWEFFKSITERLGVALHINNIIDNKYAEILWGNNTYVDFTEKSIDDRNKDITNFYQKSYTKKDTYKLQGIHQAAAEFNTSLSLVFTYNNQWLFTHGNPFKKDKNNKLLQYISVSVKLLENNSQVKQYETLQKEILQAKNKLALSKLSKKEIEILQFLASGKSEKEISELCHRSIHTIKTHLKNIRQKLKKNKNTELVKFAIESGII
jgi:DNA-binding CsgD family transcriptional regulator